ncbi:hypothetical protein F5Y04DRAFT_261487 [Hypomontagnella monticulosa]|nr:hypothetical protein F5Y04DRAFT_261487 [Hypomontagnella monticulosa]
MDNTSPIRMVNYYRCHIASRCLGKFTRSAYFSFLLFIWNPVISAYITHLVGNACGWLLVVTEVSDTRFFYYPPPKLGVYMVGSYVSYVSA